MRGLCLPCKQRLVQMPSLQLCTFQSNFHSPFSWLICAFPYGFSSTSKYLANLG